MDDESVRIIVAPTEIASKIEGTLWMVAVEQGVDLDKLRLVTCDQLPPNTIYILPAGIPEPEPFSTDFKWA